MPRKTSGTTKFGWCITHQHEQCIITTYSGYECGCSCHKKTNKTTDKVAAEPKKAKKSSKAVKKAASVTVSLKPKS